MTAHFWDTVENTVTGKPVSNATVTVLTGPSESGGTELTIYSDEGLTTPIDNPLTTDSTGYFEFYTDQDECCLEIAYGGDTRRVIENVQLIGGSVSGDITSLLVRMDIAEADIDAIESTLSGPVTGTDLTMATSKILGRSTASTGPVEELTISQALDFIGSAAQGDILCRGASGWARLAAGTSGQVLQTNGTGANPSWVTPTAASGSRKMLGSLVEGVGNDILTAGYAGGMNVLLLPGETITHVGFFGNTASPTTRWRTALYSNTAAFEIDSLISTQASLTTGVVVGLNEAALDTPYTNSGSDPVWVWLVEAHDTADFRIMKTGAHGVRYWNNSGSTMPSTAPAQTNSGAGWQLYAKIA
jgi:hypothetical protein